MGVVTRVWRALTGRDLTGRRKREDTVDLDPAARSYHHIFGHLKALSPGPRQPKRKRQNILVLQMGKVGSMAISSALHKRDLNVFHTHSLSRGHQKRLVDNLAQGDLTFLLASHELRYLIQNVALHVLVRWYRQARTPRLPSTPRIRMPKSRSICSCASRPCRHDQRHVRATACIFCRQDCSIRRSECSHFQARRPRCDWGSAPPMLPANDEG